MDIEATESWLQRPGPCLAAGLALLVACAGFALLWLTSDLLAARPLGLVTGSIGIYLVYGGVAGLKEARTDG